MTEGCHLSEIPETIKGSKNEFWKIGKFLGCGTTCKAYLINSMSNNRAVLKIYKRGLCYQQARDREIMLLDIMRKKFVSDSHLFVKVYDSFMYQQHACQILEFLNFDLKQLKLQAPPGSFSLFTLQRLCRHLLYCLSLHHSLGFVHGDLKSANLLWSSEDECLKIIDYGLSYHIDDKDVGCIQTVGSRAPEVEQWNNYITAASKQHQIKTNTSCDPNRPTQSSDLYSVGCVLSQLTRDQHATTNVHPPTNGTESTIYDDFVSIMLQPTPACRTTALELLQHDFFKETWEPSFLDLSLLPTRVLRFMNVGSDEELSNQNTREEIIEDMRDECGKYGSVLRCVVSAHQPTENQVFVEFDQAFDGMEAYARLCGRTFAGRTLLLSYYPVEDFYKKILI